MAASGIMQPCGWKEGAILTTNRERRNIIRFLKNIWEKEESIPDAGLDSASLLWRLGQCRPAGVWLTGLWIGPSEEIL